MAGNFFGNPKQYINLLTTTEDCINIFPADQARYIWDFIGINDADWSCQVEWVTVVVDQCRFDSENEPNFEGSLVIGYFEGSSQNFASNQNIVFPANMYTGPILPASEVNIPITIVNIQWTKNNGETVNRQVLAIQNWTPGIRAGDPTLDDNYIPIDVAGVGLNTATVILELIDPITVYEQTFRAKLICDVPSTLAATAKAKFYAKTSTTTYKLIYEGTWTTVTEGLNISEVEIPTYWGPGDARNLPANDYTIRGEWPGRRTWPKRFSNTLTEKVIEGVPLVVTLNPAPISSSQIGESITITATATTASGYPVFTATNIANTVTFSIQGTSTYAALTGTRIISTTTFVGNNVSATATAVLNITNDLVDSIPDKYTTYTLLTATIVNNVFSGTALITRVYPFIVNWDFLRSSLIARGSTSTTLTVSTTRSFTVALTPLTVEANEYFGEGRVGVPTFNTNYFPTFAGVKTPISTPNIFNYQNRNSNTLISQTDYRGTRTWQTRSPFIRAYVSTSTVLSSTTVTFKAVYTNSTNIVTAPSVVAVDNKYTVDLLSAPANNQLRFENLPTYLKPGDTFTLAGITWPVISFVTATNIVTTNNWNGVINPTSYFQTGVTFSVKDPSINNTAQWLGYNYNTSGNWIVFGNNIQTQSGTGTYQTWIPGNRWQISVPWYSINTGFISTATYTWSDNQLYYYRFNALPQNFLIAGSELAQSSPYFIWKTPTTTNIGVRHYIRAINYDTNTVIAWPGGDPGNGGIIPKQPPDTKILPLEDIANIFYQPLLQPENVGQWAEFYNGNGSLLTATSIITLGTNGPTPGVWETSVIFPNQQYQSLDIDSQGNTINSLSAGTYQITANIDTSNLVEILNNKINSSSATTIVVYNFYTPIISPTVQDKISNYEFKIKLFKPILGDVDFLENVPVTIFEGATQKGQTTDWTYSLDAAEATITVAKSSISTLTNVTGVFSGTDRYTSNGTYLRWNPQWPRYSSSTFTFVTLPPVPSIVDNIPNPIVRGRDYTFSGVVINSSTYVSAIPSGTLKFEDLYYSARTIGTPTLTNGSASVPYNWNNFIPILVNGGYAENEFIPATHPFKLTYSGDANFAANSITVNKTLLPSSSMLYVNNGGKTYSILSVGKFRWTVTGSGWSQFKFTGSVIVNFNEGTLNRALDGGISFKIGTDAWFWDFTQYYFPGKNYIYSGSPPTVNRGIEVAYWSATPSEPSVQYITANQVKLDFELNFDSRLRRGVNYSLTGTGEQELYLAVSYNTTDNYLNNLQYPSYFTLQMQNYFSNQIFVTTYPINQFLG